MQSFFVSLETEHKYTNNNVTPTSSQYDWQTVPVKKRAFNNKEVRENPHQQQQNLLSTVDNNRYAPLYPHNVAYNNREVQDSYHQQQQNQLSTVDDNRYAPLYPHNVKFREGVTQIEKPNQYKTSGSKYSRNSRKKTFQKNKPTETYNGNFYNRQQSIVTTSQKSRTNTIHIIGDSHVKGIRKSILLSDCDRKRYNKSWTEMQATRR